MNATPGDLDIAEKYVHLALEKDSAYAPAWAGRAWVWLCRGQLGLVPPQEAGPRARAAETRKQAALSVKGNETVMLVEDDEHILEYIKVELENSGYKVIATTNPMSAIDAYSRMSREIALVITDVVMPLIDGRELMKRIAEINPRARFLAISEHEQRTKRGDDVTPDIFLQKPFDAAEVLSAVRRILDDNKKLMPK